MLEMNSDPAEPIPSVAIVALIPSDVAYAWNPPGQACFAAFIRAHPRGPVS